MDIRQAAIYSIVSKNELFVVDAEQMEDCRVYVINQCGIVSIQWLISPRVTLAMDRSTFDSTSTQPIGETMGIMVSSFPTLGGWHAPKLRGPKDDGILEQSTLFEITNQTTRALRHPHGEWPVISPDIFVRVPIASRETVIVAGPNLHESNAPFD